MSEEKHTPLDQFKIEPLAPLELGGVDISFTNSSLWMFLAVLAIVVFTNLGMRKRAMVPGRLQNLVELSYEFIAGMVKENIGSSGRKYFPFIFSLFMFVLMCNILGLIPIVSFTATSHIVVTFALAMLVFVVLLVAGFINHGLKFFTLFAPSGIPKLMLILVIPTEIISFLARPISLSVRLAAAMTAGHILLKVFASFIIMLGSAGIIGGIAGIALPLPFLVGLIGLELFVAFLQAYIFAILTCIYLHDAEHLH